MSKAKAKLKATSTPIIVPSDAWLAARMPHTELYDKFTTSPGGSHGRVVNMMMDPQDWADGRFDNETSAMVGRIRDACLPPGKINEGALKALVDMPVPVVWSQLFPIASKNPMKPKTLMIQRIYGFTWFPIQFSVREKDDEEPLYEYIHTDDGVKSTSKQKKKAVDVYVAVTLPVLGIELAYDTSKNLETSFTRQRATLLLNQIFGTSDQRTVAEQEVTDDIAKGLLDRIDDANYFEDLVKSRIILNLVEKYWQAVDEALPFSAWNQEHSYPKPTIGGDPGFSVRRDAVFGYALSQQEDTFATMGKGTRFT